MSDNRLMWGACYGGPHDGKIIGGRAGHVFNLPGGRYEWDGAAWLFYAEGTSRADGLLPLAKFILRRRARG